MAGLDLTLLPGDFAVCRLDPAQPVPSWALRTSPASVTRTAEELSVVCRQEEVADGVRHERGWRCFKVHGPLDFALSGVLVAVAAPLAEAGVPIFALSTYDTDYVLVPAAQAERAVMVLHGAGHRVSHG